MHLRRSQHDRRAPSPQRTRASVRGGDVLLVMWMAAWIAVAILVGMDVSNLGRISSALAVSGRAVGKVGQGVKALSHLPLVGGAASDLAAELLRAASSTVGAARSTNGSVSQLRYLLAIVVALVPVIPALALYLPVRIQRDRDIRAAREALARDENRDAVKTYLARRAVTMLPFHELIEVTSDPWGDLAAGRVDLLATAELRRLGLRSAPPADVVGGADGPGG